LHSLRQCAKKYLSTLRDFLWEWAFLAHSFYLGDVMSDAAEQIRQILDPILLSLGLDLWDLEFQKQGPKWLLRVYIDREIGGGVTLSDCETVSRDLAAALDVEDIIPQAYTLEVSSPGLDRTLSKPEHFVRFTGSMIRVKTYQPIEKEKVFRGRLRGIVGPIVTIEVEGGSVLNVPLDNIAKVSLEVEF
jgi:ribosome maturation factor RimP